MREYQSSGDAPSKITFLFPTLLCGVLVFLLHLLAPPPSSLLLPPSSSLTQHRSQQHLSQQHHSDNIPHTTSCIQHLSQQHPTHNTQHHSHNISHNNISHTTAHTQHHSQAQHISWQAQHFAACQGVGCTPWRRLGTGAGCADFVAGAALCEPSYADFVAGAVLCEPPCADLVAGTALCCLPRGRMYALASAGHRRWMCRVRGRRSTL